MYTMFLLAMASARRTIYITNPYFVPDGKMIETLIRARQRGVRIVLLLPGAIDHNIVRQASRSQLGGLLKAGVQVYEYRAALLHSKTMVIGLRLGHRRQHQSRPPLVRAERGAERGRLQRRYRAPPRTRVHG